MNTVATCIAIPLVTKNEPRIDSRELALNLDRPHQTVYELVKKYQTEFESMGKLQFQTGALIGSRTGQKEKFALLNEDQAFLVLSFSRNNTKVVELKVKMIKAFSAARRLIEQHASEYLPTYHALHDHITFMGLTHEREKFLHINTNKLVNQCVGIKAGERRGLSEVPKSCLVVAQAIAANAIRGASDHKEAYQRTKQALETYGQLGIGSAASNARA